jgi:hypothetical protein
MNKTYFVPKVVRTWVLLLSVPLYLGTSALWLKEEIKTVVSGKDARIATTVKKQLQKPLADKSLKQYQKLLP